MKHRGRSVAGRLRAGGRNGGARPAARSGSAAVAGQPRSRTEGRRGGPLGWRPQQGCRSARRTEARGGDIGAGGTARKVAVSREALHLPWPSRRRPQRGCSSAHDNTFAGGQSASSSEAPAFLCQTGLRLSGHCGSGWRWTAGARRGGGGRRTMDRWRCRGEEPAVGVPTLGPSLCLGRWIGRAFCLGRRMGVCLRLHPGRWPQGKGGLPFGPEGGAGSFLGAG